MIEIHLISAYFSFLFDTIHLKKEDMYHGEFQQNDQSVLSGCNSG